MLRPRTMRGFWPILIVLAAPGCSAAPGQLDDEAKIVRATLRQLVADGQPVCVDEKTNGPPLAIFRAMSTAPVQSRRLLAWRPPSPLRPPVDPSARTIARDTVKLQTVRLREPNPPGGELPPLEQRRLNDAARVLSGRIDYDPVTFSADWGVRGVVARWWPLNRLRRDCEPRFVVSNPIRREDIAFVTVKAGHWGTTYALERAGTDWRTSAEWSRWLY